MQTKTPETQAVTLSAPARRTRSVPLFAFFGLVLALAIAGGVIASGLLAGGKATPGPFGPFAVGQDIRTSFGILSIEGVDTRQNPGDVAVPSGQVGVHLQVSLTNEQHTPIT